MVVLKKVNVVMDDFFFDILIYSTDHSIYEMTFIWTYFRRSSETKNTFKLFIVGWLSCTRMFERSSAKKKNVVSSETYFKHS